MLKHWDSVIDIATRHGLDSLGFQPHIGDTSRTYPAGSDAYPASCTVDYRIFFSGVKRLGRGVICSIRV